MAIRAASICRLDSHPASSALRPYSPNCTLTWPRDIPWRRPRWCLRYLTRLGDSIRTGLRIRRAARPAASRPAVATATATIPTRPLGRLGRGLIHDRQVGPGIALGHDLALVDPALHADAAEGGGRLVEAVVDVGPQCV